MSLRSLLVAVLALGLAGSTGCTNKKVRRFGASCGQSSECESGLCYNGFCTASCTSGASCSSGVCIEKVCQPSDEDYDHDGLTNAWEAKHGLNAEKADSDGDGIPDGPEVGADLAHPLDHNGDGVSDALQSNVVDSDNDCMVDAFDKLPGKLDPLPDAALLCASGVCAGKTGEVNVLCTTTADSGAPVVAGCKGCSCNSSTIADFQAPEALCDSKDNDCDGVTDNDFKFQGATVGQSCQQCGFAGATCPDGSQMNGAVVGCTAGGQFATCMGLPFDKSFTGIAVGAPEPRAGWSIGWRETIKAVTVYSGKVAAVQGLAARDEEWFLGVDTPANPAPWQRSQWQSPGARAGAAIASDPSAGLLWLVGGENAEGTLQTELFRSPNPSEWNLVPTSGAPDAVAALPAPSMSVAAGQAPSPAFVLNSSGQRALLIFDRHYPRPLWHPLEKGQSSWVEAAGETTQTSSDVRCAVQVNGQNVVFAALASGKWLRFSWDGTALTADVVPLAAAAVVPQGAQCVIDGQNNLHVLGGYQGGKVVAAHSVAAAIGTGSAAQLSEFQSVYSDTSSESAAFQRAGGMARWSPGLNAVVLAGGESNDGSGRLGRPDVQVWNPQTHTVQRADKLRPRARFAHAGGYWPQQDAYCIAGGLTAELPVGDVPRVVPVEDAWCVNKDGEWVQKVASGVRYAYGAAALDTAGQRLVLAGGMALKGTDFSAVSKLWSQGLLQGGSVDPALAPTATVQTVSLGATLQAPGQLAVVPSPQAPQVAAAAFAYDSVRNRLILVDGYGPAGEVQLFQVLDLKTLAWTDLKAQLPSETDGKPFLPMARYGALALYDATRDIIAVVGGSLRHPSGNTGYDVVTGPTGVQVSSCMLTGFVPLDLSQTLFNPHFVAQPLPLYVSLENPTKDEMLLNPYMGGPVFAPVIYDGIGGHAWMAVPDAPPPYLGPGVQVCSEIGSDSLNPLHMNHQLSLDVGVCGGQLAAKPSLQGLDWAPSALFSSSFQYVDSDRSAWLAGGLEPDGAVSSEVSRLGQACQSK
ncbi:MAG: hypothetical protein HY902_06390 [Deltaproteobacteria bacterium]|nr:hypothetical protein [Deltaproteobacteria bacterium]